MKADDVTATTPEAPEQAPAPYFTVDICTGCRSEVHGLHGRWTCKNCGECSPYSEPPEGWQTEIRPGDSAAPPPRPRSRRR